MTTDTELHQYAGSRRVCAECGMNFNAPVHSVPRYRVQRTLHYAHTVYCHTSDLDVARETAAAQTAFGYRSQVIDLATGEDVTR